MEFERRFTWLPWPKSPSRRRCSTAFDLHPPSPPSTPRSPIHKHSLSFKDVETLLNPPPFGPHLTHSNSSPSPASLKDIQNLLISSKPSVFHRVRAWAQTLPQAQNRVVVYCTSLRVVRKTFEDCRTVRLILKGYRVKVDERDLSMDAAFVGELQAITGKRVDFTSLPKVFVNGKDVGGAEEIRRLHENGELGMMIGGLPAAEVGVCSVCAGYRFLVCQHCNGSHRVYVDMVGFKVCCKCNENGLSRCPSCTSLSF